MNLTYDLEKWFILVLTKMRILRQFYLLQKLRKNVWKDLGQLSQLEQKKLRGIVEFAYRHVPFYRHRFREAKVVPSEISCRKDIEKLPFVTKEDIQESSHSIISKGIDITKCHVSYTSGSTGTNFKVVYDPFAYDFERAVLIRANLESGQRIRDKWATITSPRSVRIQPKFFQKLGILQKINLSVLSPVEVNLRELQEINPHVLYGYSSYIWTMAKAVIEGFDFKVTNLRLIFGTADVLDDVMREDISSAFGVQVLDQFGCVEVGRTAWECPHRDGYHMDIDSVIIELLKGDEAVGEGEIGEVVYTCLYNHAMPLIRYRVGDLAIATNEKCSCGRSLPLLKKIVGRKDDLIVTESGHLVSPITFAIVMKYKKEVKNYRIIQNPNGRIEVLIELIVPLSEMLERTIVQEIQQIVGRGIDVEVTCGEIPPDKSGKLRSVISFANKSGYKK